MLTCCTLPAAAQSAKPMELRRTRYEMRAGEPAQISATSETLDFLLSAKTRTIQFGGASTEGLVVGPNKTGDQILLAASVRAKPGEYAVTISATSATGEVRQASVDMVVQPRQTVPSGSTRPPVVLLNGWEIGFTNSCPVATSSSDTFGNLASYLVSDGVPVVYLFDNCVEGSNQPIEYLGNDLGAYLNSIKYDNGTQVPQIDLVAFSLGGLVARAYLAGLQPSEALTPPTTTLVRDMVLIATPNFGSFVTGDYSTEIQPGTQSGELVPGSSFLWNLANWNQRSDDLRGVNTIAVAGNAGEYLPNLSSGIENNNASDGIVSLTSASLGFVYPHTAANTRVVPYCHVDPADYTNTTLGTYLCNAPGIANVTDTNQYTGQIVRSFLNGTTAWKSIGTTMATDPYLSANGGMFFALLSSTGAFATDLTSVTWGTLTLTPGGNAETIYYDDFVAGTGVFQATSTSLGSWNSQEWAEPVGYFSAYRTKIGTDIFKVGPLISMSPLVVSSGGAITITGQAFSGLCSSGCQVVATPAGTTTGTVLKVTSWSNTSITATLPATLTGLLTLTVDAIPGSDSIAIMAATSNPSTIAAAPASLQFAYTTGGTAPSAQSIQITNSGSGTLAWTATASASWLSISSSSGTTASGTAPSTLSVSVSPAGLSAGTYSGNVQISSTGASNTPLSVAVTLTVTQSPPALALAPQALTFNYTVGGAAPASQSVSITNAGAGALAWTASSSDYWIVLSAMSGSAPGTLSISINPANLAAATYTSAVQITAAGATGSPAAVTITLVVQGSQLAPAITAAGNAASFQTNFASATWVSIFGTNLSTSTYTWQASDFSNGLLPTSLQGVSVTIDGIPAYIDYISPTQINVLAPDDITVGPVPVQVTTAEQASNSLTLQKSQFSPAFFTIDNGAYVAALHANYTLVGSANLLPGVTTLPAQPGETIQLYGTGFGPTNPPLLTDQLVASPSVLANSVQVTIGGVSATVVYAGLVGSGLYQLNVTVPASLPNGDAAVVATIGGVSTQSGVAITVQ